MDIITSRIYFDMAERCLSFINQNRIVYLSEDEERKRIIQHISLINEQAYARALFIQRMIVILNFWEKTVIPRPRKVTISQHLKDKLKTQLNSDIVNLVWDFKRRFENGENINGNLSIGVFRYKPWDYILNSWNIHHLHLSARSEFDKRKMKNNRSNYLLFFLLFRDAVYFIDVKKHPKSEGFTSLELLEIMESEGWMKKAGFHCEGEGRVDHVQTDLSIYQILKAGGTLFYEVNGKIFMNIDGITSAGSKWLHTDVSDTIIEQTRKILSKEKVEHLGLYFLGNERKIILKYKEENIIKALVIEINKK